MKLYNKAIGYSALAHEDKDCAVIAASIVCKVTYGEAHKALRVHGRENKKVTSMLVLTTAINALTDRTLWWGDIEKRGLTLKQVSKLYNKGRYLVLIEDHILALINGSIEDSSNAYSGRVNVIALSKVLD